MSLQRAMILCLILALCGAPAAAQPGANKKPAAEAPAPLRFPITPQRMPFYAKIDKVGKDGSVQISRSTEMLQMPAAMRQDVSEGYYLGIVKDSAGPSLEGARVVRVQITDVGENEVLQARLAKKAAESLKEDEVLMLVRPVGTTTAQMKLLPDVVPLEEGPAPGKEKEPIDQARLAQSFNNLKQIGLALHNFHDAYRHFPPAVIAGPDNKPRHSWRVLLLPFLDQAPLYNQYRFDEPWDGPNNKKLLDKMPPVFSDPIHGENKDFYTHYVAITGDDMAFTAEGADFDGMNLGPAIGGGRGIVQFTDGTSNTLIVGPVGPDRKIPWMKPEDIVVDDKFPDLGKKGGFAVPYKTEKGNAAPFLFADGAVRALPDAIDRKTFHALLTLDAGEIVGEYPSINPPPMGRGAAPVIYIITEADKTTARLAMEPVEQMPMMFPGMGGMGMPPGLLPPGAVPAPRLPGPPLPGPPLPASGPTRKAPVKKIEER